MITACIITRDQQDKLEKCLQHLKDIPVEIVVVDTGSVDDSKTVAKKYTENVCDFPWIGDFAAAKNFAIEKAPTDIVFVVDSDEYVTEFDAEKTEKDILKDNKRVGRVKRTNIFGIDETREGDEWINRIFDRRIFHYVGRIHEQVERRDGQEYVVFKTSAHMLHDGYLLDDDERRKKTERNISLLKDELDAFLSENEGQDLLKAPQNVQSRVAYILYQLGKSYYMKQEYITAVEYFELGLSFDLNEKLEYVIDMVETYGYAMINAGQAQKALLLEGVYDVFCGRADFCFLMGLIYLNNERFDEAIVQFEKATTFRTSRIKGANSYLAYYNAGVICECSGRIEDAKKYYRLAGNYDKAEQRLKDL